MNVSNTVGVRALSSPLLINRSNVPELEFVFTICHLTLSLDPLIKAPAVCEPVLFMITPLENVSKVNTSFNEPESLIAVPEPVRVEAAV